MPKGIPKVKEDVTVLEAAGKVIRSRDEEEAERVAEEYLKTHRTDLGSFENRLPFVPERLGWVRRWVNDLDSRIPSLMRFGWKIVDQGAVPATSSSIGRGNTDIGGHVSVVSTIGDGPLRVVLMEIPRKLFDMQMDGVHAPVRNTEQAIREGRNGLDDTKHVYTPKGIENRIETPQ